MTRAKNRVRGASDRVAALATARQAVELSVLDPLAKWSFSWLPTLGVLGRLTPRRLAELNATPSLESVGLERDLAWAVAAILRQPNLVRRYLRLKDELDSALLQKSMSECLSILDRMDEALGPSLHTLSARIALIHLGSGLEAQKEFVGGLRKQQASAIVLFCAFWWSVRAEDRTTPEHFRADILRRLETRQAQPETRAQIRYYLLNDLPESGSEGLLLSAATAGSAIDIYEMVLSLAVSAAAERRPVAESFATALERIAAVVSDVRLTKTLLLAGRTDQVQRLGMIGIQRREDRLLGRNVDQEVTPSTLEEFYAAAARPGSVSPPNEMARRLQHALSRLSFLGEEEARASAALTKLGLMLGHSSTGQWSNAVGAIHAPRARPFDPTFDGPRYVAASDGVLGPLSVLSPSLAKTYAEHLEAQYPKSALAFAARVIAGNDSPGEDCPLTPSDAASLRLHRAALTQDADSILAAAEAVLTHAPTKEAVFLRGAALLELERVRDALESAVDILLKQPLHAAWLPLDDIVRHIYDDARNQYPDLIQTPILFDFCTRHTNPELSSYVSYTAEDYVLARGVDRPSRLDWNADPTPPELVVHFLSEVCSASTLRLFTAFESERELEEERIAICQVLSRLVPEQREQFEDEARGIVTSRLVKEAIKQLQASKISIDTDAVRAWAHRNLREDFQRYQALRASGLVVVDDSYREALMVALETGNFAKSLYDVPQNEASDLFVKIATRLVNECAFDPEHGLDCYLSLRIRHGTMSGLLRSAPEKERVITRRVSETGDYRENTFWRDALAGSVDRVTWGAVEDRLAQFSRDLDALIFEITAELIQINRDEKPRGLFKINPPVLTIYGLATEVSADADFDDFVDRTIDIFWILVEISLREIRSFFDGEMRERIMSLFRELELDIRHEPTLAPLADAVIRGRNDIALSLDQVRDWFELPTATSALTFTVDELVTVSLEAIKSLHRDFSPKLDMPPTSTPPFQGALNLFSDIFFIIFENAYTHSGSTTPDISIRTEIGERSLKVRVENTMARTRCTQGNLARVRQSAERIRSGAYLAAVSKEGGTGLPKLAKLIGYKAGQGDLEFDLDCDGGRFWLEFTLPTRVFETTGDGDGPRVAG